MRRIRIELLDDRGQALFGEREALEGQYPSAVTWESAAENLYNRHLPQELPYRTIHRMGTSDPIYALFTHRPIDGPATIDPLCRITIADRCVISRE